jgi:hypothetical protein
MALKIMVPCSGAEHTIMVRSEDEFYDDFEVDGPAKPLVGQEPNAVQDGVLNG